MDYGLSFKLRSHAIQKIHVLLNYFERILTSFFDPSQEQGLGWFVRLWNSGLYLAGVLLWGKFLNWGNIPFDFHDWAEVWAPRIAVVRDALIKGTLPFHMNDSTALRGVTDRFFVIPDVISTPQMILLRFLEPGAYILVNQIFLFTLATLGLLWLRRRLSLSLATYTVLFLLFHFNGNILAHISIGHINWGGYFLFPFFVILVMQLLDGERNWNWVAKMSFLLFFIFLQGSFHHFIWCILFLCILAATCWKTFSTLFKAITGAILLSLFRILPPILGMGIFDDEFIGGYPTAWDLLLALVDIKSPAESLSIRSDINILGWWELDMYIGITGASILIFFGLYRWFQRAGQGNDYPELILPVSALVFLSIGRVYRLVMMLSIPLFNAERVSSRIFLLPFTFLIVISAIEIQQWVKTSKHVVSIQLVSLGGLLILINDLWQHLKLWQVTSSFKSFPLTPRDLSIVTVNNHADAPYFMLLGIGAGISLITMLFLIYKTWHERKIKPS